MKLFKDLVWGGGWTQLPKVQATLPKDLNLILSTHVAACNHMKFQFQPHKYTHLPFMDMPFKASRW